MVSFDRESAMLDPIAAYVRRKSYRWQERELQFYEHRIDLFAFSRALALTVAVEMKLTRWRRAVEQAVLYQLCADHVFVAMPEGRISRVDTKLLCRLGIGLIAVEVSGRCREIVVPQRSPVIRPYYRDAYIALLQGRR
jgi:hypothetical protein